MTKHRWPDELVDYGRMPRDADFGGYYYVTAKTRTCPDCGRTRAEAKGKQCGDRVPAWTAQDEVNLARRVKAMTK